MADMKKGFLPVLPLKDIVVFPSMVAPLFISNKEATVAIENTLLTQEHQILLIAQKPGIDTIEQSSFYNIGILGKVVQILKFPDGSIKALIEGVSRVKLKDYYKPEELFITASYELLSEYLEETPDFKVIKNLVSNQFNEYIQRSSKINIENFISLKDIEEPGKLADIIATYLTVEVSEKQKLIEELNVYKRLEIISNLLSREIELLEIEEALQERIKSKLGKNQKEYFLREKLKAIKEELGGEEGTDEVEELRAKIENASIPHKVKEHLYKELNKLERMSFLTAETSVIRTYIDTILELPWNKKTTDSLDIDKAKTILDEDHYGLEDVKERILEFLAVKKLSKEKQATIICLIGPPGVGKTSLAKSVARSLNREFAQVSLGGINDESEVRGHRRTYVGAMPGKIIRAIQDAGTKNPVILLDEIEKMVPSHMGDPTAAMLEVLDPTQNSHYTDHYIDLPFDLSDVFFIATANMVDKLYKPLKDRLETIYLSGYTEEEKLQIAIKFLLPKQYKLNGITEKALQIKPTVIRQIIDEYTREAGVRELERSLAKLCRKFALELATNPDSKVCIDSKNISKYLGASKFEREKTEKEPQIGLVHGLAWTEVGGEILEIEATTMPGKGILNLTGRLGEIMQESAKIALSYARSNYKKLGISQDVQNKFDIHIHAADGATPKDGPSAGIALTIALISALTKRPVRSDFAMTGEITLRGRILPIGGLKEKAIAALRNNITKVIIPKGNTNNLNELPDYIKNKVDFITVENLNEVIKLVLLNEEKEILEQVSIEKFSLNHNGNGRKKEKILLPKSFKN